MESTRRFATVLRRIVCKHTANRHLVDGWRTLGVSFRHPITLLIMSENNDSYIGRKAAAEKYRRGERTLERDISQALKVRNEKFLENIRLRTKDGDLLPGTDVTFEKIDELKNTGQVPTWEIAEAFLLDRYGLRSEEPQQNNQSQQPKKITEKGSEETGSDRAGQTGSSGSSTASSYASQTDLPPLPRDPVEQAALLRALYQNLQRSFQVERERNDKIFALIETIPKQQEQTNILLREFQVLMKSENASLALPRKVEPKAVVPVQLLEAQTIEATQVVEKEVTEPVKSQPKKPSTKKKRTKKKKATKTPQKPPTFAERHLPSFSRLFGSTSSKKR